jgi:hypothetical protein
MFTRAKMLAPDRQAEYARLIDRVATAVRAGDRDAMRSVHIDIFRMMCRLGRIAFERYGLAFPPRVEDEMVSFFNREWPV